MQTYLMIKASYLSEEFLNHLVPQTSQCMWLMQALGFLLSALPVEDILRNLHSLITPYIQQLEKLADETVSPPTDQEHTCTLAQTPCTHIWSLANRSRLCAGVVSLQWIISLQNQIGFDPISLGSDLCRSSNSANVTKWKCLHKITSPCRCV